MNEGEPKGAESLALEAVSDIRSVAGLHERLWALLASGRGVRIEASSVERVDAAVLQLLCAFRKASADVGIPLEWGETSAAFQHSVRVSDLGPHLGLNAAATD